ncbi:MAG: type III-B CRISPR module RAMP protein Cmr6 [Saprospiraceae bacterium]|nr:type III-B CRISPR module RAMP protein Cmr6 [Saprospiraceae bacterium]
MNISNPGLAFNKTVFNELSAMNKSLYKKNTYNLHHALFNVSLGEKWKPLDLSSLDLGDTNRPYVSFNLTVDWPGMMMGLGYGHGAKTGADNKSHPHETEVKTGFYFDFTTGIPVVTGSSVKGILRSHFPNRIKCNKNDQDCESLKKAMTNRIISILKEILNKTWDAEKVNIFEQVVFEGKDEVFEGSKKIINSIPSTNQDIFLEAFPCKGVNAKVLNTNIPDDVNDAFLGEDVLTPHDHPLRNPVPIKHIKLLPGVEMKFQFLLNDKGGLTSGEKLTLFKYLLENFGAGARRGTGFGQFKLSTSEQSVNQSNWYINFSPLQSDKDEVGDGTSSEEEIIIKPPTKPDITKVPESENWPSISSVYKNEKISGYIHELKSGNAKVQLFVKGQSDFLNLQGYKGLIGIEVDFKIVDTIGSLKNGNYQISRIELYK